ncbi:MAG: hypothetical protein ACRDRH_22960 [Pseudonocardia sp.]
MSEHSEYRYSPTRPPDPCPDHPGSTVQRCERWLCRHTFHIPPRRRDQPRRYCSPTCRVAEHRRLRM